MAGRGNHRPIKGPRSREGIEACPACDYPMTGLGQAAGCPECGMPLGPEAITLTGVPRNTSGGPRWRRWVLIGTVAMGFVLLQGCPLVMLGVRGIGGGQEAAFGVIGSLWAVVLAGAAVLILTRSRQRPLTDVVFTREGCALASELEGHDPLANLVAWSPGDAVELKRAGRAWYRLRIGPSGGDGSRVRRARLDVGVRCRDEEAEAVRQRIARCRGVAR